MRQTTQTLRLRDIEEDEEKREDQLDPFEQLQRDIRRTGTGPAPRQAAEPVGHSHETEEPEPDPFEQLQRDLGRGGQYTEEPGASARVIDRSEAGTDWGALGRYRPSGATEGYTAPQWYTDDPEELERQLGDLSGRMNSLGGQLKLTSAPLEKLQPLRDRAAENLNGMHDKVTGLQSTLDDMGSRLETAKGNVTALQKTIENLTATMHDENASSRDRMNAQMSLQAMLPRYNRAVDTYNAMLKQYGYTEGQLGALSSQYEQAYTQFQPLENVYQKSLASVQKDAAEYDALRRDLRNTWKQYTAVSSMGDDQAVKLLEEAEELRKKAEGAATHGMASAEYLRQAEKLEAEAAQAQGRYAQYLMNRQNAEAANTQGRYSKYLKTLKGEAEAREYLSENPLARREREKLESAPLGEKILNTIGGTALNFFSGRAGSPLITLAQIMEMPEVILYDITKDERFNPDRYGMRTSKALEASDTFREEAQRMGQNAGTMGKQIVDTGYAAGSMMSAHGIAGAALGAINTAPLTSTLESIANSSPLLTSRAARFGANLGLNVVRDVMSNPGNIGVSFGAGVRGFTEAMEKGDNFGQALSIGIEKAALEYFSNKLFSGTPFEDSPEGKGYVTELVEWLAKKLGKSKALESFNKSMGGKVFNWLFDKSGEGLEEVVSAIGEPLVDWANENDVVGSLLRGEKPKGPDWPKFNEIADEFIGGVLLSLLMTGGEETVKAINRSATMAQARQAVMRDLEAQGIDLQTAKQYAPEIVKAIFAAQKAEDAVREAAEKAGPEARPAAENTAPVITAGREAARDAGQMPGAQTANRGTENPPIDANARATESETGAGGQAETQPGTEARTEAPAASQGNAEESTAPVITAAEPLTQEQEEARLNARDTAPVITAGMESTNAQAAQDTAPVITAGQNEQGVQNGQQTETAGAPADGQGTELPGRNGGRDAGERTGEQAEGLGRGAKNWRTLPQAQKAAERQNRGKRIRAEKVSGQDLGIHGATAEKAVIIYPESAWDEELQAIDRVTVKETGQHATFILGSIPVPGTASGKVRGVNAGGRIIVQVDSLGVSATQLFAHEMFHEWARNDPQLVERVKQKITDTYSREEFDAIVDKYLEKKAGAMDLSRLDEAAMQRLVDKCTEEVCADAYAGINAFGQRAGKYVQEARAAVKEAGTARETEAATERRTGPPEERYSTAEEVLSRDDVDWMDNWSSIKDQLAEHAEELKNMEPVAVVRYNHNPKESIIDIMLNALPRIGGGKMKNSGVGFIFDRIGAKSIDSHATGPEARAVALAAPYVAKYGKLIAGQKNHEGTGLTTLTFAAPAIINGNTANVGVVVQFDKDGRPRAVNAGSQSGGKFKLKTNEAFRGTSSRVDRYGQGTALDTRNASKDRVTQTADESNTKFSEAEDTDTEYLSAVERGDMETAQRLVDEAAKAAGYTVKAYHGTPNGTYNVFRDWSYFTEDKDYADIYQNQGASSNGYKKTAENPRTYSVYLDPRNVFDTRTERDREIFENEFYQKWGNGAPLSDRGLPDWTDGDDLIEFFDENGYDYDAFYLDEGGTGGYGDDVKDRGISIIVKDSAQVKFADPVTYDDDGNIIPLSERFDSGNKDIRFSADDTASRVEELRGELRRISDTGYRDGLRASDLEAFNRNEERRKQLRREIAKLEAIEPQLRQAEAELEQRRDIEYQKQLLEDGGVKAVQENERKIKDLTKKVAKLQRQAGRAEAGVRNTPTDHGTEERINAAADASRNDGAERSVRANEMDSIPESAADYARRKERGTLRMANRERIAALKKEIKNRKDSNRLMQMHVDQGPEAVAREIRSIQKLERELRDLEAPQLPKLTEKKANTEAIPESAAEYDQRKRLGTLPKSISEKNRARIEEIRQALETRDTEEHKAEIYNTQGAEALAAEVNAIKRMKAELNRLEQGDRLQAKPPKSKITWAKRDLADSLIRAFSVPSFESKNARSIIEAAADRILQNGELSFQEENALFDKLWNAGEAVWQGEEGKEVYRFLRNTRVFVPAEVKEEFADYWNDFRKKAFALGVYLTNDTNDQGWDSVNMELADAFPGLFNADELDARAVLERIVQLAEEGRGEKMTLGEYAAKVAEVNWASQDELESNLRRKLDWALQTFAKQAQVEQYYKDKIGEKITREREDAAQRLDEAVAKERQRGDRRVQEAQNHGRAMLEAEKTREALRRGREKEARREAEKRKRERAVLRELQNKTLRQLQWISRNKNKFPQEMKARVEDILRDMDIYAVSMADEMHIDNATGKTWRDLADIYQEAQERDPNWMPSKDLDRIVSRLNDKKISELDPDALRDLFQAAVGLRTELYNRNNLINDLDHRTFEELYDAARGEIENAPGGYDKGLPARYAGMQLTPMNRMEQMAGWDKRSQWYSMAKMLEQGERDSRRFQAEAKKQLGKFLQENQDWVKRADGQGKNAIWYEIEVPELLELGMGDKPIFGDTVKVYMTPAQKVELYLESKGYDNLRHMTGGRTFADRELYSQGKRAEALSQGKTIRLAPETVRNLVKDLTPEEQSLADLLEQFYNGYSKKEINRVSNLLYGYDKAMEEYYAPIYTNDNYTKSEPGVFDLTAEGVGNLKERKVSTTPSLNLSAFDAFERSVDKTGKFVGLAIPIRNMNTLLNWWGDGTSMADTITHKWGEEGLKFIQDLLTELQSGREKNSGKLDQLVNGALNKYISSVFGFNPSIVLKQFASYPLAGAYLGYENMPKWIPGAAQVDTDLISKYTGELDYRMLGYSTPETAALKDNPGILQTKGPLNWLFGGGAITWMDGFTVRTLWTWAENKVNREQPGLERGTEAQIQAGESEYYQAVAKEFEEAVSRSQPMYDTMHRSDIMRQSGAVTRAFTLFKTVPQQEYNMLRESFGELKAAKQSGDAERIREAKSKAGRTVTGILAGNLMIGAITFLNALWKNRGKKYRDDDGELTLESVMSQMGKQYFKDAAGLAIGGDAAADLIASWIFGEKLYDIDSPGIEQVNELYQALQKAGSTIGKLVQDSVQVLSRGGDWGQYMADHSDTYLSAVGDAASILGTYAAGLPVENVKAYLLGALGWMSPKIQVAYEDAMDKADKSGLKGLTGDALEMRMSHILRDRTGSTEDETVDVLSRLYEAGMTGAVPPDTPESVTVNGESRKLDTMQAQTYSSVFRDMTGNSLNELINDRQFRDADAKTREKMISIVYDYARDRAKAAVWGDYKSDKETAQAVLKTGVSLADWAAFKATADAVKGDDRRTQILELIDSIGKNAEQKDALYYAAGYKESTIDDTPWHKGASGGAVSGRTYAPASRTGLELAPQRARAYTGSGLVVSAMPERSARQSGSGLVITAR